MHTKFINRFTYPKLTRSMVDGQRLYNTPDGTAVPSVTTILNATADHTALNAWKQRVGSEEAVRISRESAGLGTKVHAAIERYFLGEAWDTFGTNVISQMAKNMSQVMIEQVLPPVDEIWGFESALYAQGLYSGTADAIGVYNGQPAIIDFKTSKKIKKRAWIQDYFLQCCAYAQAHDMMFGTNIRCAAIMMVDRDCNHETFVIQGDEFDHYSTLWAHRVARYYGIAIDE